MNRAIHPSTFNAAETSAYGAPTARHAGVDTKIGFVTEPVVSLGSRKYALYHDCRARLQTPDGMIHTAPTVVSFLVRCGAAGDLDCCLLLLTLAELEAQPTLTLGCSLSSQTLADDRLWARFIDSVRAHREVLSRLVIEIVETLPFEQVLDIAARLQDIRALGCRLAIEEFSARQWMHLLLYTVEAIFDMIKIHCAFRRQQAISPYAIDELVRLIALAQCLSPVVVVSGIQTARDLATATTAGATHGQGDFFSRAGLNSPWGQIDTAAFPSLADALRPADKRPAAPGGSSVSTTPGDLPPGIFNRLRAMAPHPGGRR